ncbi:MAG: hypothetical protein M3063_09425 [Actinomycetota bacterium]|nr:hypothetical protein [Actinomycetota bacterium]
MHPIERLRYVARVGGADAGLVAAEAGYALAAVAAEDPAGLVPACRRLVDRHTMSGPMWWLAARVLASPDPAGAARQAAHAISEDALAPALARTLPDEVTVAVIGWPDAAGEALRRRGDLEVLVIDGGGGGSSLARRLEDADMAVAWVRDAGTASAVVVSGLVLLEAAAAGPSGILARIGSHAAASVAAQHGVPVWAALGTGRVLPGPLWDALLGRVDRMPTEPWDREVELVPAELLTAAVGSDVGTGGFGTGGVGTRGVGTGGVSGVTAALTTSSAPAAPELLRSVD